MKDPLRYYLAEGWMCLFFFIDGEGKFNVMHRKCQLLSGKVSMDPDKIVVDGVAYNFDNNFFMDYGTICDSREDALLKAHDWLVQTNAAYNHFQLIQNDLIEA